MFTEWVYVNNTWEIFGSVTIDLSNYLTDVQINGTSVVTDGVANVPVADYNNFGATKFNSSSGIFSNSGIATIYPASSDEIKNGNHLRKPVVPTRQHEAVFYGLAKAAGHDEKDSALSVGQYSEEAKTAIQSMLNVPSTDDVQDLQTAVQEKADADAVSSLIEQIYNAHPNVEAETASVVSITDGADGIPVKSLIVGIEPAQDLHGYDNPWPAGGGKNLLEWTNPTNTINGVTFTVNSDGSVLVNGTANGGDSSFYSNTNAYGLFTMKAGEYVISGCPAGGSSTTYLINEVVKSSQDTGNGINLTLDEDTNIRLRIVIRNGYTANNLLFKPMIRLSSIADSTFAPYSNICPITGWTGAEVTRTGVNVWDEQTELGTINSSGEDNPSTTTLRTVNYIPVLPGKTYYYKSTETAGFRFYDANKIFKSSATGAKNVTFTVPSGCYYLRFVILSGYGTTYNNDISINYPATDTEYHPGTQNETYDITFPTEAGTVYGGTLDVVNGVLTVDRASLTFDGTQSIGSANWRMYDDSSAWLYSPNITPGINNIIGGNNIISDTLKSIHYIASEGGIYGDNIGISLVGSDAWAVAMRVPVAGLNTSELVNAWLAEHNIKVVYKLSTPIIYTLTPQEVSTLLGQNNIWADTGDTSLAYRADTRLYVERLTASD